jgi:hypothetical protein
MSITIERLNTQRVVDPRTDLNSYERRTYQIFDGPSDVGYQRVLPDGAPSASSMTFSCNPPSSRVFVNRRVMVTMTFELTFTGTTTYQNLLQMLGCNAPPGADGANNFDGPRAFPIANATQSIQVSLNNDRLSQNTNRFYRGTTRYANHHVQSEIDYGMTPTMLDNAQSLDQLWNLGISPLLPYGTTPEQTTRSGFAGVEIVSNTNTQAVVRLTVTEPLWLAPFLFARGAQDTGLIGIQTMSVTLALGGRGNGVFGGLAGALWSHVGGADNNSNITNVAVSVASAEMLFSYLTPDTLQIIPEINNYPYSEPIVYTQSFTAPIASGGTQQLEFNNIQLNSIPSRVIIFVGERDQDFDYTKTDTYWGIENVNLSFDNRDAILSNASSRDLFNIAAKNNTNLTWTQWSRHTGSVLALDFGDDIPLRSNQAVGLRGSYNFRMSVTARNLSGELQYPQLTVLVISTGVMTVAQQNVVRSVGILSNEDVLNSKTQPAMPYRATGDLYGGGWWDDFKSGFMSVIRPVANIASKLVPFVAPEFAPVAQAINTAVGNGIIGGRMIGGRRVSRAALARALH